MCVGTFSRADKKVSDPPAEYAPLGSAPAADTSSKGKGKAAAQADDSGKGKTGSLTVAAPPRYPPSAFIKLPCHGAAQGMGIFVVVVACSVLWLHPNTSAEMCHITSLLSVQSDHGTDQPRLSHYPPYKLGSSNPRLPVCFDWTLKLNAHKMCIPPYESGSKNPRLCACLA